MLHFGTDGVRGVANAELSVELVVALGRAAARVLPASSYLVGRDTRRSGPLLQAAFSAGLAAEGVAVVDLGVLPTPGVAWMSSVAEVPAAMVSASHNVFADNGVKVFAAGGLKLPDSTELRIEEELSRILAEGAVPAGSGGSAPVGHQVGTMTVDLYAAAKYVDRLGSLVGETALEGMRLVVDCANGAAFAAGPDALRRCGASVEVLSDTPDGANINDMCGSTHPEKLSTKVLELGADLGLAFDGDADRLVAVDHTGEVRTGDELLAVFASDMAENRRLTGRAVVVTVMSNLGLRIAMAERGIEVRETPVGDRYVLEALQAEGLSLGGEQSGHLVFRDMSTTGDGILTALLLADLVRRSGRTLADLVSSTMTRVPQLLRNLEVPAPGKIVSAVRVEEAVALAQARLGSQGRVLVRASGTEPLVRVMVEATDHQAALEAADLLCNAVEKAVDTLSTP